MSKDLNEHILIELLSHDPDRAIELTYQQYWKELYLYIFSLTRNKSLTEDLLQETFLNLWKYKGSIQIKESIIAYLKTSARNIYIRYSKNTTLNRTIEMDEHTGNVHDIFDQNDYIKKINYTETEDKIRQTVNTMPQQMQHVFLLRKENDLSYKEIGAKMNITEGTVKKQLYYALKLLKKKFSK